MQQQKAMAWKIEQTDHSLWEKWVSKTAIPHPKPHRMKKEKRLTFASTCQQSEGEPFCQVSVMDNMERQDYNPTRPI